MEDFANVLAVEIKEDLAKRYFGSRKKIENDCSLYTSALAHAAEDKKESITALLTQICGLLADNEICDTFLAFTGLPENFFPTSSPLPSTSTVLKTLTDNYAIKGFTWKQKYRNGLRYLYTQLESEVSAYCEEFDDLQDFHQEICRDIKQFYRNFDLTTILRFLREIDDPDMGRESTLNSQQTTVNTRGLDKQLSFTPPPAPETVMKPVEKLNQLRSADIQLKRIAQKGYTFYKQS